MKLAQLLEAKIADQSIAFTIQVDKQQAFDQLYPYVEFVVERDIIEEDPDDEFIQRLAHRLTDDLISSATFQQTFERIVQGLLDPEDIIDKAYSGSEFERIIERHVNLYLDDNGLGANMVDW